jgi:hypothetical protein
MVLCGAVAARHEQALAAQSLVLLLLVTKPPQAEMHKM